MNDLSTATLSLLPPSRRLARFALVQRNKALRYLYTPKMAATFLYEQAFGRMKPVTTPTLKGRTIIVTGANTGLGVGCL